MLPFKRLVSPILKSEACTSCLTQCVFCLCLCNCFPSGTQAESTAGNPGGSNGHPGASSGESFNGFSNIMPGSQGQSVSEPAPAAAPPAVPVGVTAVSNTTSEKKLWFFHPMSRAKLPEVFFVSTYRGASQALKRSKTRVACMFKKKNGSPAAHGFGPVIVSQKKKQNSPFASMAKSAEVLGVSGDGCDCSCKNPFKRKRRKSAIMSDPSVMSRGSC